VEYGASHAAFELRYGLRPPSEAATAAPTAPTPSPDGRQLVNSGAIAALTNPLCHTPPEDDLGELITDVMDLPEAQRSTVRTLVSGMLRSVTAKPSMIFALVAFVATLGLGLGTDVGRAAAHTVVETTRDVGRAVVKRAADVVAPAVRHLRPTSSHTPRQLGAGRSSAQPSTLAANRTVAAAASSRAHARVVPLAISAGRGASHAAEKSAAHAIKGAPHAKGAGHTHGAGHHKNLKNAKAHTRDKTAKTSTHANHGKGHSKKSGRRS
jgi:hypothetical protein